MFNIKEWMTNCEPSHGTTVNTAGNERIKAQAERAANVRIGRGMPEIELGRALYIPKLVENYPSPAAIDRTRLLIGHSTLPYLEWSLQDLFCFLCPHI